MKILSAVLAVAMLAGAPARPQTYQTVPDGAGGWITYGGGQPPVMTMPNGVGGWNSYQGGQPTVQTFPNGAGGYNTYVPPRAQPIPPLKPAR